jgi:GDP-D-mannose 3',5'-epimerase
MPAAKKAKIDEMSKPKCLVAGGGGFIGSWLAKRLKSEGHYVVCADVQRCAYFDEEEFCNEFMQVDLREPANCLKAAKGCEWVFNLAADMGGMGFIQSNNSRIGYNSTMLSLNVLDAARQAGAKRYFYSSSACVYNEGKQMDEDADCNLRESMAWPAQPQDIYGLEKLYAEEITISYGKDFDMETRIARFHNIYGDHATWKGGREKSPAAFCRKIAYIPDGGEMEMWGNGKQTRSFCYIDDCVEGILRLMKSDCRIPLNLGSDEIISMNDLAKLIMTFDNKNITLKHIPGPEGVRGRNSQNDLIKEKLGWAPSITVAVGMKKLYDWIKATIAKEVAEGMVNDYSKSSVVAQVGGMDMHGPFPAMD